MIELLLLRHAHAGNAGSWHGADADRPLSPRGREQAERLGAFLAAADVRPTVVISSPKARARETAGIVAVAVRRDVRLDERLAAGFDEVDLARLLRDHGDPARPMLVGHDPDFSALLTELVGAGAITMRKGALARVDVEPPFEPGTGLLRWLLPPELLPRT